MPKAKLVKCLSVKAFGDKLELQEIERLLDANYVIVKHGIVYNDNFKNYEQWLDIYKEN